MVLNISGRTDIVAFYSKWFINRYREGYLDVRNPFYPKSVSRISFSNVDAIVFCTKNPSPLLDYIEEIKIPILLHVTITPYKEDIEPNVPKKDKIIEDLKKLSKILGKDRIVVRYDPIFLNDKYNLEYHIKAFERLCSLIDGYASKVIVSFIDDCKNVRNNYRYLKYREFSEDDYKSIGINFSNSAKKHNLVVHTCFEERDLVEYGFIKDECLSKEIVYLLTGKKITKKWAARKCHCVEMVDIGVYNTCNHKCKYCYANFSEREVLNNMKNHDVNSSLLIGHLEDDDIIKERI